MMNARRIGTAALCRAVVLPSWIVVWLSALGSAGLENASAPIIDRAPSLAANAELADAPQLPASGGPSVVNADVATAGETVPLAATETTAAPHEAEPRETESREAASQEAEPRETESHEAASIVVAALADPSEILPPPETQPVPVATATTSEPERRDARGTTSPLEILDECIVVDVCIDRYLWTLYQRTPKEDTIKIQERRSVTVRKKRRMVTVTKTFTKLVDEDFAWKDPKAADRAGMPMMDYVIGGMDRRFRLKLFHALYAAEQAGLSPGITSAFRDDYRQSIASGLKAASDRSYHGGSFRGGYGHGLAADVVSVKGDTRAQRWTSTETLWKWIDAHGKEFGIGRPYLDRDPPHLAPIDGTEYAAHNHGTKAQRAGLDVKKRSRIAVRDVAKRPRTARSSKVRTI